jgi:NADH:ubiquinone oxidoreductase subunit E
MGACGEAPVLIRNNKHMLCAMSADKLDKLIEELK